MTLSSAVLLAACGGSGGGAGAPSNPNPSTTLVLSSPTLALAVSGAARVVTVTNTGTASALSVQYTLNPPLPTGSSSASTCTTLAAGASCQITITPGGTTTAAVLAAPAPVVLRVGGANTNVVSSDVHVLDHGSIYQSGYVFSLNDTTPATGSVGGKAAALNDAGTLPWSTTAALINAASLTDGQDNTQKTVAVYDALSVPRANYASGICMASSEGGYSNWYLPAVCELANAGGAAGCGAGDSVQQNLVDKNAGAFTGLPAVNPYWSSTEATSAPVIDGWTHQFVLNAGVQFEVDKVAALLPVRCVRALAL